MERAELIANLLSPWQGPTNGRISAPVTMMVPGQLCGSHGCMTYPADLLRRTADRWRNQPLTLGHPLGDDGWPVSASQKPDTIIGYVAEPRFEDGKLKATIHVLAERAFDLAQQTNEVSVGVFVEQDEDGTVTALEPDHLALLPHEQGACSWADGCGVRANAHDALIALTRQATQGLNRLNGGKTMQPNDVLLPAGVEAPEDSPATNPAEDVLMPVHVLEAERAAQRQQPQQRPAEGGGDDAPAPLLPVGVGDPSG